MLRTLFFSLLLITRLCHAENFYVSPSGSDSFTGKLPAPNATKTDGPFATLEYARDHLRGLKDSNKTVFVRDGVYELVNGLQLTPADSNTTYRNFKNEHPVLLGGRRIRNFSAFRDHILRALLPPQGIDKPIFKQIFYDGTRQTLARYPNANPGTQYPKTWAYVDGQSVDMYRDVPGDSKHTFVYRNSDSRNWLHPESAEVFIFPRFNWWNNILPVKSINKQNRTITLGADASYAIRPGDRFFFQNAFEELDSSGEWFLDKKEAALYFWPPTPIEGKSVCVPTTPRGIIYIETGTTAIRLHGLSFECSEGSAITVEKAHHCSITACRVRNVGDYNRPGINVIEGDNNEIVGCDISHIGQHGISISGGDTATLTSAINRAENNYIHHIGEIHKQGVGVLLRGVGNIVSHNLIHDAPRMGILFFGNNLAIEYNEIRHVSLETQDTGAIYTGGRDWIGSRGSVIRYNYLHDILGFGKSNGNWISPYFSWGIYLDDNAGGVDVVGNIVTRSYRGNLHLNGARDNVIQNNIFLDAQLYQLEMNGWASSIRYWSLEYDSMVKGYEQVAGKPAWKSMRHMDLHPKDAVLPDGTLMAGNVFTKNIVAYSSPEARLFNWLNVNFEHNQFDGNLYFHNGLPLLTGTLRPGEKGDDFAAWRKLARDTHSIVADPKFVNPAQDDYRLRPDSPAFKLGFKPIPFENIGPYQSPDRATWPIVEEAGARETLR